MKINIETEGNGGETRVTDVTLAVDTPDFSERELQLIVERVPEVSRVVMSHQIEAFTSRGLTPLKRAAQTKALLYRPFAHFKRYDPDTSSS